jgi:hypothetical protein
MIPISVAVTFIYFLVTTTVFSIISIYLLNATKEDVSYFLEASLNPRTQRIVDRHPEEVTQIFEMLSDKFAGMNGGSIVFYKDDAGRLLRNS